MAQLGERFIRIEEVGGSNPPSSIGFDSIGDENIPILIPDVVYVRARLRSNG